MTIPQWGVAAATAMLFSAAAALAENQTTLDTAHATLEEARAALEAAGRPDETAATRAHRQKAIQLVDMAIRETALANNAPGLELDEQEPEKQQPEVPGPEPKITLPPEPGDDS